MTDQKRAYITVLATDSYLEGVVVLNHSLLATGARYPLLVLTTPNIGEATVAELDAHGIRHEPVPDIEFGMELEHSQDLDTRRWAATFSKLQIFAQAQFDKVVYVDADMLVYRNLDELFEWPHMAAANSGGMLPDFAHWRGMNTGLLVVEPSLELYEDILRRFPELYRPGFSDQDLLNAYYPDWPDRPELHLDHGFNMFFHQLDEHHQRFGYGLGGAKPVKVVHYVGEIKPWSIKDDLAGHLRPTVASTAETARDGVRAVIRAARKVMPDAIARRLPQATGNRLLRRSLVDWLRVYRAATAARASTPAR